jgi:hypothetical protein
MSEIKLSSGEVETLKLGLTAATEALNCWTCIYADDMCSEESVAKAKEKIYEYGTLAYIANINAKVWSALILLREKETP